MVGNISMQLEGVQSMENQMSEWVQIWKQITEHGLAKKMQKRKVLEEPVLL